MRTNNSLIALSFFVFNLLIATTWADPIQTNVIIICPCANELYSLDNNIIGLGAELIFKQNNPIQFISPTPIKTQMNLNNYKNTGIEYDSVVGQLTCAYGSLVPAEQALVLNYNMTNGTGGLVQVKSLNTISILFPVGFKVALGAYGGSVAKNPRGW